MPTSRRRSRRSRPRAAVTSRPSTSTRPEDARSSPLTSRRSVDLPAPDRPITPVIPPCGTCRSTSSSAATDPPAWGQTLTTPRNAMAGGAAGMGADCVMPACYRAETPASMPPARGIAGKGCRPGGDVAPRERRGVTRAGCGTPCAACRDPAEIVPAILTLRRATGTKFPRTPPVRPALAAPPAGSYNHAHASRGPDIPN